MSRITIPDDDMMEAQQERDADHPAGTEKDRIDGRTDKARRDAARRASEVSETRRRGLYRPD